MMNQYRVTVTAACLIEEYGVFADNVRQAEVQAQRRFEREWPTLDVDSLDTVTAAQRTA